MGTPVKPSFISDKSRFGASGLGSTSGIGGASSVGGVNGITSLNRINGLSAAAKTPFQPSNPYTHRGFRSEAQVTRTKTGTRFYGSTRIPRKQTHEPRNPELNSKLLSVITNPVTNPILPKTPKTPNNQLQRAHSEPTIKYQVKVNDKVYKILRKIGSGGSAKVYEGFEPQTCQTSAIKIINMAKADQKTQESYFNEIELLRRLKNSEHVVRIHDSEYKAECKELVIVMEKGDADLSQVIDSHFSTRSRTIDGIFIKFYWREMVQAVHEIHQHGIVHADLKPVNFILVKNRIKLIDFGIASAVDPGGTSVIRDYQIGTINYMAPEALRNRATDENNSHIKTLIKYNSKVDIWSLGCILYNLVYGRPPFDKYQDILSKIQAITNPLQVIPFPPLNNQKLLNCMKSCLRYNPSDRLSAKDLLEDPYLKEDVIVLQN